MATSITNINDISSLKLSLERCGKNALELVAPILCYIEEKQLVLQKIMFELQHRLEDAERKLSNRNNMLTLCRSRIELDEEGNRKTPNCSSEENAVRRAMIELKSARKNFDEMKQLMQIIENRLNEYDNQASVFKSLNTDFIDSCSEYLQKIITLFNQYKQLGEEYGKI